MFPRIKSLGAPERGVGIAALTIAAVEAPDGADEENDVRAANEFESAIAFAADEDEGEKLGRAKLRADDGIEGGLRRPATIPGVCDGSAPAPFEADPEEEVAAAFSE
jgi:hypothetical protein